MHLRYPSKLVVTVMVVIGALSASFKGWAQEPVAEPGFFDEQPGPGTQESIEEDFSDITIDEELESAEEFLPSVQSPDPLVQDPAVGEPALNETPSSPISPREPDDDLWVIVEPSNVLMQDVSGGYYMIPYRLRRPDWGSTFTLSYSMFHPKNYTPSFAADFDTIYGDAETPLIEVQLTVKRNFSFGSIGMEVAIGTYENQSYDSVVIDGSSESLSQSLSLMPVRVGAIVTLDNLFIEPYVAPFVSGGVYTIIYKEQQAATSFNGNTQVAPYVSAGFLFQLDWLDKESARNSFIEAGIQNTFVYLSGRQFIASQEGKDPNFEADIHANAGLMLEF